MPAELSNLGCHFESGLRHKRARPSIKIIIKVFSVFFFASVLRRSCVVWSVDCCVTRQRNALIFRVVTNGYDCYARVGCH